MKDLRCMWSLMKETLTCVEYNVQENDIDGDSNKPSSNLI